MNIITAEDHALMVETIAAILCLTPAAITPDHTGSWKDIPCKLWTGSTNNHGYGQRRIAKKCYLVHRLAYAEANGPIPDGLFVLHRCDTPACYEPAHLFLGTQGDNMRDMAAKGRGWAAKTHCPQGHEYTPENTVVLNRANGKQARECRTCNALRNAAYQRTEQGRAAVCERARRYRARQKAQASNG